MLLPGATASAATWTALNSGTTAEISNIEYQSPTRFWFTTKGGAIFTRQAGGTFLQTRAPSGLPLNDIEFQRGGNIGLAVGNAGQVLRSIDAGQTWSAVSGIPVSKKSTTFPDCTASESLGDVNAVRFAGDGRAWIMAAGAQLASSQPASAANVGATGQWFDANRSASNTCKVVGPGYYAVGLGDAFFLAVNPNIAYFCTPYFGDVYLTTDNLATAATLKPGSCGNGTSAARRITGDQSNPNRGWAVSPGGAGASFTAWTQDGWATSSAFGIADGDGFLPETPYDVASSGATVLAAGTAGMILESLDGVNFRHQPASGGQATSDWRAVALASPSDAAVGGVGGQLAISSDANVLPAPATTATTTTTTPSPAPASPVLTPVSATQPKTTTTGGTVITIYRLVRVTGHSGRYVPVRVKAKGKRTIRIALYPKGRTKAISTLKLVFKAKGVRLAKVKLPATAKLGKYTVVVKVYKGRNRTGRSVRQAIVVA